ncbi:TetR/AcrR family transcriptional regulator [Streptomyces sp. B1866]|uniref:TetR/AcrR family transcriptional regulator n=1 Tax=Streptomyces sp. B1866 TaxID=3075431 RepID=UPI00288E9A26|nr:TetR/AcrR family transcriptional regulator [Streptomyces sp. B1866]MDT3398237.1 TetR/AcrR family transcriptional regulator [Streptomyces sp. B1866]
MTEKRRRRLPRKVREQQIIDVAVQVFSKRGYHAASVDEIAELAGVSKPMVYLYLDSKEGLFVACLRREAERLVAGFQSAARGAGSPELRLWAGVSAFFTFVSQHRDGWVVLYRQASELSEAIAAELAQARRAVMAEVAGLVRAGASEGTGPVRLKEEDADFVAQALVGAADSLTEWMERHPGESPDHTAHRLMNMVWIGMRNVLAGEFWEPPQPGSLHR